MEKTIDKFLEALQIAGVTFDRNKISIDDLGCPHTPRGLRNGEMAIYTFQRAGQYLKIGKAGSSSNARFRSQHYSPYRANSNLAKSLLNDPDMQSCGFDENNIDEWIKQNIRRIDILIDEDAGIFVLNFLEAFLHCVFHPKYEGFKNQR